MGLIRKSLALGTIGVVNPSSKKQRVAKATQRAAEANARAAGALLAQQAEANRLAEIRAREEHEFRYATDETYRKYVDDKQAAEEAARAAEAARIEEAARIRRERKRQRNAAVVGATARTLEVLGATAAMLVVSVVVWLPQLAFAAAGRGSGRLWLRDALTRPFRR